eukprot:SAG31_NODE_5186_length_2693_cov_1.525443_3_plen_60_part_00
MRTVPNLHRSLPTLVLLNHTPFETKLIELKIRLPLGAAAAIEPAVKITDLLLSSRGNGG